VDQDRPGGEGVTGSQQLDRIADIGNRGHVPTADVNPA
jgi:hypothetical protein